MNREQEKEQLEQKIAQAEQKERRYAIEQRILFREQAQLDRKKRNHRIFTRGAMLESFLKKPLLMADHPPVSFRNALCPPGRQK